MPRRPSRLVPTLVIPGWNDSGPGHWQTWLDGTVLVAGDDDPYLPHGIAAAYGLPLKMATTVIPGGGHLNVGSGYGEWPAMLDWCGRNNLAFY